MKRNILIIHYISLKICFKIVLNTHTYVGSNLSNLARELSDIVYDLVKELIDSRNKNSYWIAYNACRKFVKRAY